MIFLSQSTSEYRTLSAKPQATLRDRLLLQNRHLLVASALFFFHWAADVAGSPAWYSLQEAEVD